MQMNRTDSLLLILVIAGMTFLTMCIPFLLFPENRKTPACITYLSKVLPYAIIGMLVVYCFRNVSVADAPHGLPELIAAAAVVLLHVWRRNTLLSIGAGTLLYMILVQVVFA